MRIPYQEKDFFSLLKESGYFDKLEIKILRALIDLRANGKDAISANQVSKEAKISVTNAYKYLYSLQNKGLVEMKSGKNKLFWLAESSNPFPRMASIIGKHFLKKKQLFERLKVLYDAYIEDDKIWKGDKLKEEVDDLDVKTAFLFDIAKDEVLILTKKFYNDYVILDALKRAVSRGVNVRIISELADPDLIEKLKSIEIDMRLRLCQKQMVIVDNRHGLLVSPNKKGAMFLNYITNYKTEFERLWKEADEV